MSFQSAIEADAHYATPDGSLTVHARLNDQSRYDIISISSPTANTVHLSVSPPANTHEQTPSASSHLAAQYSRGQLAQALIMQNNPQDFSGEPLPSGTSVSTQGMVFSHDGFAGASTGVHGPGLTQPNQSSRSAPYSAHSVSSRSGATSRSERQRRPDATDAQIHAHLQKPDGSLRTIKQVGSALHTAGLGAGDKRIAAQLQAAGGARHLPGATDAQIHAQLHNPDGSLRTKLQVASALHTAGLGASNNRIQGQLQAAGGARLLPGATDAQIHAYLHNPDGSLRVGRDVASALHAAGLGADNNRIRAQLHAAGGARLRPGATDAQINEHLYNPDGSLRAGKDVASALHAAGLGAGNDRIWAQLQAARER
ncbi:hypothetical protein GIW45_25525 [Pseudomonas congelans]|nr:hypothetical protein [Pseudomonas congelans]